jgi:integrase
MTRLKLHFVQAWVDAEGRVHRYFRRPGYPRVRLPGLPGSTEFMAAYQEALEGPPLVIGAIRSKPGTVAAAVAAYLVSPEFSALATGTQVHRRAILQRFRDQHGDKPMGQMPAKFITLLLGEMKPHAARNWFKALRALCQFCVANEMMANDVTQAMKPPKVKTAGHHTWTEEQIAQYEGHHPIGSKARLALALGLYTIQRRGDVVRMGRQHISEGVLSVRQEKTGAMLALPVHPALQAVLDATPSTHLTFLVTKSGQSFSGNDFSEQFRKWCTEAGLPAECTFHGLRKVGCCRLADAGCSAPQIAAWSGHGSLREVERYTRAADQKRMARDALERMLRTTGEQTSVKLGDV